MSMTIFQSNGILQPITQIDLKTFLIFCGNYRHFEVNAIDKKEAIKRFSRIKPAGFTKKDITQVEEKF